MRLCEIREKLLPNPFKNSLIQIPLYHGTNSEFSKFLRPSHGIYVTPSESWARSHYGNKVIILYADVKKIYNMEWDDPESDYFYDVDYEGVTEVLNKLSKQGYNCCKFGGESESMVLFNDIDLVNANTGKPM